MKKCYKVLSLVLALVMVCSLFGCKKAEPAGSAQDKAAESTGAQETPDKGNNASEVKESSETQTAVAADEKKPAQEVKEADRMDMSAYLAKPQTSDYLKVALNVFYNDSTHGYSKNEAGTPIYVTEAGTYELSFSCENDLSKEAREAGVTSLTDLTAVYFLDMGAAEAAQSPLKACKIMYDKVVVDGQELTVTMAEPKSALKGSGLFDTNDPVNAWDGSQIAEVDTDTANHVVNFSSVTEPKTITVRFTLSDMVWEGQQTEESKEAKSESPVIDLEGTSVYSGMDFTNVNAVEFCKYLGNGINLGNTMEASGRAALGVFADPKTYETYWSEPVTTPEMLKAMKSFGFDTIRIPVSWTNTMPYEKGDYTINPKYLDRVEEIVNYALDAEMFVIVNDHWDGGWYSMFGSKTPETVQRAWDIYENMWKQVADRFKDYPDMLILESANEELGNNLNNNGDWPDSGYIESEDELYANVNKINQLFVDIVRKSGGNNDDRFLLIAGYNTDFAKTCDARFKMPKDTAKNKLLLSVHYYTPWNYCGSEKDARWGLKKEYNDQDELFKSIKKFTDQGYGIIIGEYGALPYREDNKVCEKQNTLEFTTSILDNCDLYGYVPMLWSCNDFFNRISLSMISDEIAELFRSRCYAEEVKQGDAYLANVKKNMKAARDNALEMWEDVATYEPGTPVAWIMWNGGAGTYSVGDVFNPADNTAGITAHNAIVEGAGEYTVSLDFAGGNSGLTFAALAIADAELVYPNNIIVIEEITYDGNPVQLIATPYTASDDGICTRVNLINDWVTKVPDNIRLLGSKAKAAATILEKKDIVDIHNISIKFRFIVK